MPIERFILIAVSFSSLVSAFYIPRTKYRLALLSFLAFEATTWASVNILVQTGAIAFPVRSFSLATQGGFIQNFLFFPMIFSWFIISYQNRATFPAKILHYIVFVSVVVWFIYFVSVYTDLEEFITGTKYSQLLRLYLSMFLQFGLCHVYIRWFSRETNLLAGT